ncbi:hypothetical protein VKT23_012354 [Stygiomarasmius scandens]|uniref:DUF6534 domain-containing protein n=1 Tax=Marasmiellus scandens TaxID=2682957 RepID=A0ABR1J6Y2_9AGAR
MAIFSISVPVQHFLGYRIYRFSESRILFAFFSLLSLGQAGLAFASSIGALLAPNVEENRKLIPVADSWLALAVACDGGITLMLSYYLSKSRTGRRATDRAISKLIRTSVETALPVTLFCICDLATLTSLPNSNLHLMFALPMARLYTNTLMTTLNTRSTIRKNLVNNGFSSFFPQTNQDETIRFRVEGQKDTLGSTQNDEDQTNDNRGNAMKLRVSAEGNADHWVRSKPNHQTEECELSPL